MRSRTFARRSAAAGCSIAAALFAVSTLAIVHAPAARADAAGDTARTLLGKYRDAAVTFDVVIKLSGGPLQDEQNTEIEAHGFVIDPSGLIVTTNAAIDPMSMVSGFPGAEERLGNMTAKVVSVRILSPNGDEIPAKVVLRDTDRNLAFIRPLTTPTTSIPYVDLKSAGKAQVGDAVFILGRMGKSGNRGPQVGYTRLNAQIERPRLVYVVQPVEGSGSPGDVVFNEQGQPLGLLNIRFALGRETAHSLSGTDALEVVVPADDVQEIGKLAPQVKDVHDADTESTPPAAPTGKAAPKAGSAGAAKKRPAH